MTDTARLDKCVADLMRCSRADAQRYVDGGWVSVDGVVVASPQAMVDPTTVAVSAAATLADVEPATLLLHKPAGIATADALALAAADTRDDADPTDIRCVPRHFHGLQALLPLDDEASGLLVLTQDPRAARRLREDGPTIEQEYLVEVDGTLPVYGMARLARGMRFDGRELPPCKVSWQNEIRLRFAIKDVRPGQLRHMCAEVGLAVVAIRRLRIGRVPLSKIPAGRWRYLPVGDRF